MKISQREAHRLKKRVTQLEEVIRHQRVRWASEWLGGVLLCREEAVAINHAMVKTARRLGHAVVIVPEDEETYGFYALPLPEKSL